MHLIGRKLVFAYSSFQCLLDGNLNSLNILLHSTDGCVEYKMSAIP